MNNKWKYWQKRYSYSSFFYNNNIVFRSYFNMKVEEDERALQRLADFQSEAAVWKEVYNTTSLLIHLTNFNTETCNIIGESSNS